MSIIADELYAIAVGRISDAPHPDEITRRLDDLMKALTDVKIVGETRTEGKEVTQSVLGETVETQAQLSQPGFVLSGGVSVQSTSSATREAGFQQHGRQQARIEFGRVQASLRGLLGVLGEPEIWILIDEWSETPQDLQPFLADLLRRTLLPIDNFVVKIAAIEHRSVFYLAKPGGDYIGLELGADVSADLNLDDFLVFDNDQQKAVEFFKNLLYRHYKASSENALIVKPDDLIKLAFTQYPVFDEFVRAVEGVPRDALNLAAKIASKAYGKAIAMADVRSAARNWYQQDKASVVRANPILEDVLTHVVDTVIGKRRARAFLFPSNVQNEAVDALVDARILHILKRNISSNDEPGRRYDVFKIDYGCYVDLINTDKRPEGLLELEDGEYAEVPVDDYRSIRRAVLRPEDLTLGNGAQRVTDS